jgi:hypothetical protein
MNLRRLVCAESGRVRSDRSELTQEFIKARVVEEDFGSNLIQCSAILRVNTLDERSGELSSFFKTVGIEEDELSEHFNICITLRNHFTNVFLFSSGKFIYFHCRIFLKSEWYSHKGWCPPYLARFRESEQKGGLEDRIAERLGRELEQTDVFEDLTFSIHDK